MKRLFLALAAATLLLGIAAPAVIAREPAFDQSSRVLMAFNGDVTVARGDTVDAVVVTRGTATIRGTVRSLVVFDGQAVLEGARVESVFTIGGRLSVDASTIVSGDVRTLDTTVAADPGATIGGSISSLDRDLIAATAVLAPALVLFALGFAVVTVVAGLALAALGARQVRTAEGLMSREPGLTLVAGLAGLVVLPAVAILAMITVVGAPLGLAILLVVWPAAAYAGYLVAGIWLGEWLLYRGGTHRPERPYMAAVVGLVVLQLVTLIPFVGAIASLFGFGAVLLMAWRTFRQPTAARPIVAPPARQPMGV
jgi:hypothetical protein